MEAPGPRDSDKDDRIRILEFQVDHLRRELDLLKARHEEAIYSVAWHFGWPVRVIERAIRRLFARRDDDDGPGASADVRNQDDKGARQAAPPPASLTRERIAQRIAQRIARPA